MNDELKHYGILGQKWGVRRFQNKDGTLTPAGKKRYGGERTDRKRYFDDRVGDSSKLISEMTNKELQNAINRIQLQQQFASLTRSKKKVYKGKECVLKILKNSGENVAQQFVTYVFGTAVNKAAEKFFNVKTPIVNPKKGQKDK